MVNNTLEIRTQIQHYLDQLSPTRLGVVLDFLAYLAEREGNAATQAPLPFPDGVVETPPATPAPSPGGRVDLASVGMDRSGAASLRASLTTFAEDWDSPEMDIYDHYDAARNSTPR
ncbi:MAG TPA: hypothetical protein IGR64_17875 [Leptolyngbyaceae cyanobacterium M65_K2018_010]|nr:hypothetical protein [Leptolyngbyaceae cyanobacterium M65_K2018_010]